MICCTISLLLYVFVMHDEIDIISNKILSIIYKIILNLIQSFWYFEWIRIAGYEFSQENSNHQTKSVCKMESMQYNS